VTTTEKDLDENTPRLSASFRSHAPELSASAELAALARVLHHEGWADHSNGHITYKLPDGTLLATPFEFPWDELRSSDMMRISRTGEVLDGHWTVSPALQIHIELHHARPDVGVAVHNHPHYATVWAAVGRVPPAYDQLSGMLDDDDIVVFDEYVGTVESVSAARANVYGVGAHDVALLRHHGALVTAPDVRRAYFLCTALEWRSRLAWEVEAVAGRGCELPEEGRRSLAQLGHDIGGYLPNIWEAAVRREIRRDASFST
jgi:ribulose-5-phosphate 4-epimerase/fuculose-1-phosphate aldolase